MQLGAGDGMW